MVGDFIVERDGMPPLSFSGEQLCDPVTITVDRRSWSGVVYQTDAGEYVLSLAFRSEWDGELPINWAFVGSNTLRLQVQLSVVKACPLGVGYPAGERYLLKQQILESDLERALFRVISHSYRDSGLVDDL